MDTGFKFFHAGSCLKNQLALDSYGRYGHKPSQGFRKFTESSGSPQDPWSPPYPMSGYSQIPVQPTRPHGSYRHRGFSARLREIPLSGFISYSLLAFVEQPFFQKNFFNRLLQFKFGWNRIKKKFSINEKGRDGSQTEIPVNAFVSK